MPNEPEKNIERQLRGFARKRREEAGAPFELHRATRRMLQGEVRRQFGQRDAASASWFKALFKFRPRLIWGQALAALFLLAIVGSLLLPTLSKSKSKTMEVAMKSKPAMAEEADADSSRKRLNEEAAMTSAMRLAAQPHTTATENDRGGIVLPAGAEANRGLDADRRGITLSLNQPIALADGVTPGIGGGIGGGGANANLSRFSKATPGKAPASATTPMPARVALAPQLGEAKSAVIVREAEAAKAEYFAATDQPGAPKDTRLNKTAEFGEKLLSATKSEEPANRVQGGLDPLGGTVKTVRGESPVGALQDNAKAKAIALAAAPTPAAAEPAQRSFAVSSEAPANQTLAYFNNLANNTSRQRFTQVAIPALNQTTVTPPAPAQAILNSFELEQAGDQLRFIDADGSTYEGQLSFAANERVGVASNRADAFKLGAVARDAPIKELKKEARSKTATVVQFPQQGVDYGLIMPANQSVFFRASGTNQKLNQLVVITGNIHVDTNAVQAENGIPLQKNVLNALTPETFNYQNSFQNSLNLFQNQGVRIQGQAVVGGTNVVPLDAVPVAR